MYFVIFFIVILNAQNIEEKFKKYNGKEILRINRHNMEVISLPKSNRLACASECLKKINCNNAVLRGKNCTLFTSCQDSEYYNATDDATLIEKKIKCKKNYSNLALKMSLNADARDDLLEVLVNGDLAILTDNKKIDIWDLENYNVRITLNEISNEVLSIAVLHNGNLACGLGNGNIEIWNLENQILTKTLIGQSDKVFALAVLLNGDLVSGSDDGTIRIWNLETGLTIKILSQNDKILFFAVLFNGDLVNVRDNKQIDIWDLENYNVKITLNEISDEVLSIAVLHNGNLACGLGNGNIEIWNLESGTHIKTLSVNSNKIFSLALLFNGDLVIGSDDGTIRIWDLETEFLFPVGSNLDSVLKIVVLNNGNLASLSDKKIKIFG